MEKSHQNTDKQTWICVKFFSLCLDGIESNLWITQQRLCIQLMCRMSFSQSLRHLRDRRKEFHLENYRFLSEITAQKIQSFDILCARFPMLSFFMDHEPSANFVFFFFIVMHFAYLHFTNAMEKDENISHFPFRIVLFDISSIEMHNTLAVRVDRV